MTGRKLGLAVLTLGLAARGVSGQKPQPLHDHPAIRYATTTTTDRVAALARAIDAGTQTLKRDPRTGYLLPLLDALGVAPEPQLLVFAKTGVQRADTSPHTPRALDFDESGASAYVPGAPPLR